MYTTFEKIKFIIFLYLKQFIPLITIIFLWSQLWWAYNHDYKSIGFRICIVIFFFLFSTKIINQYFDNREIHENNPSLYLIISSLFALSLGIYSYHIKTIQTYQRNISFFIIIIGIFCLLIFYEKKIQKYFLEHKIFMNVVIITCAIIFSYFLLGKNLQAKWNIIDDYGIMQFLGSDQEITINEIPNLLMKTEVTRPGKSLRYRPSYFTLRIFESFFWGNNSFLWYFFRLVMFCVIVTMTWKILLKKLGIILGGLFTLYIFCYSYWIDIWTRLGPAETYAAFGFALYCLGFFNCLDKLKKKINDNKIEYLYYEWILMLLGSIIAVGSKENFLILLIPSIYVYIYSVMRGKKNNFFSNICTFIILTYIIFIGISIITSVSKVGHDIYFNDMEVTRKVGFLYDRFLLLTSNINWIDITLGITVTSLLLYRYKGKYFFNIYWRTVVKYITLIAILLILYMSQLFFYNGKWPTQSTRYDFPGMLTEPFFWLFIALFSIKTMKILSIEKNIIKYLKIGLSLGLLLIILQNGFIKIRQASANNAIRSNIFTKNIMLIVDKCQEQTEMPLVFDIHDKWDYEPIYSVRQYLITFGVKNPLFVRLNNYPWKSSNSDLDKYLINHLYSRSINGGNGFMPIGLLKKNYKQSFSVGFAGPPNSQSISLLQLY